MTTNASKNPVQPSNADNVTHTCAGRSSSSCEEVLSKHRKELFGDCALIEIIHLHDCFRGALKSLEHDVLQLVACVQRSLPNSSKNNTSSCSIKKTMELERRVAGRFNVIWTVFKSHSHAEDEFIWPALKTKTSVQICSSEISDGTSNNNFSFIMHASNQNRDNDENNIPPNPREPVVIEQEEYEEDHADEERMFSQMDRLLKNLREVILPQQQQQGTHCDSNLLEEGRESNKANSPSRVKNESDSGNTTMIRMVNELLEHTRVLSKHLMQHLQKEETQCLPLVVKHLSKEEIHELVGQIMGRRSADTIAQIMTMAVQNLEPADRVEMVKYMKQSMAGTFFDRWLLMSGWMKDINAESEYINDDSLEGDLETRDRIAEDQDQKCSPHLKDNKLNECLETNANEIAKIVTTPEGTKFSTRHVLEAAKKRAASLDAADFDRNSTINDENNGGYTDTKRFKECHHLDDAQQAEGICDRAVLLPGICEDSVLVGNADSCSVTSQDGLEKLIRAIATNPSLTPAQKNTTIQGLRDSVWKSNQRHQQMYMQPPTVINETQPYNTVPNFGQQNPPQGNDIGSSATAGQSCRTRRVTPPSVYYRKNQDGKIELAWAANDAGSSARSNSSSSNRTDINGINVVVPLFSASELAPTYHDGATGAVLGCPHYACACKLRHPKSGRLYTCRLCCEQQRELPNRDQDETLDRYAVTEIMCMKCNALQPSDDRCINPECESFGKPFARYFCRICHLYDGSSRPIFHCPYCNTCRIGLGLGIDYRHCMRCNACVALSDRDHRCIPQKLQGNCPICRESLFLSTLPLRGLKCGHVMHLSCYTEYIRGFNYTCPLCMRSMEDMKDYFALLDTAIRMQPMPAEYINTMSNIYCQDCNTTGRVPYHIVGRKCSNCGSYNTREMGRVNVTPAASPPSAIMPEMP